MIISTRYGVSWDPDRELFLVESFQDPICPDCGRICSGYDHRRRHLINEETGVKVWYLLRRCWCSNCQAYHLELPDFMEPRKHYPADVIDRARSGDLSGCPAEESTIRRWLH